MAARPERLFARLRRDRPGPAEGEDAALLDRFARARDGEAFAHLVGRHGPTVAGVCQRILRQTPDADDAVQAVFVVLAGYAPRMPRRVNLGGWLYKVAVNVALKARRTADRRTARERHAARPEADAGPGPEAEARRRELSAALDEELARLPTPHRDAIVLCDIQGHSQDEAAELLGRPRGTVAVHLARGRERLRRRLSARGWSATGVSLAAAAIPDRLAGACVAVAISGMIPVPVRRLADRYTREVFAMKAIMWTAVALVLGVGLLIGAMGDRDDPTAVTNVAAAPAPAAEKPTYAFLFGESISKPSKPGEFRAGINIDHIEWWLGDVNGKNLRKLQDGKGKRVPVRPVDRTVILKRDDDGLTLLGPDGGDLAFSLKTGPLADAKIVHSGQRTTFSFSPDGKAVAFANKDGALCRIALDTMTLTVAKVTGLNASDGVQFTPDGKRVAYMKYRQPDERKAGIFSVCVADPDGGNEKMLTEGTAIAGCGFLPDGRVGVLEPTRVQAYDPATGKAETVSGPWPRKQQMRGFGGFSPDGTTFLYDLGGPYVLNLYSFNLKTRAVATVKERYLESFQEMIWVRVTK